MYDFLLLEQLKKIIHPSASVPMCTLYYLLDVYTEVA
jgi:hypothetical protein